LKTGI